MLSPRQSKPAKEFTCTGRVWKWLWMALQLGSPTEADILGGWLSPAARLPAGEVASTSSSATPTPPARSRPLVPEVQIFTVGQVVVVEEGILNKRVLASHQIYKVTGDYLCLTLRLDLRSRDGLVLTEDIV